MNIFLTGATGFLGTALLRELLLKGHSVSALVRGKDDLSALKRLKDHIFDYDPDFSWDKVIGQRLHVVKGDVSEINFGLGARDYLRFANNADILIHNAAITALDTDWAIYEKVNMGGAREAIKFASHTKQKALAQVSSAYVAGARTDTVHEDELDMTVEFRNRYERSKALSESLVRDAAASGSIRFMILRPSIIIADSQNGRMSEEHHLFDFLFRLFWTRQMIEKWQNSDKGQAKNRLRLLGNPEATKNFVPVDYVAKLISLLIETDGAWGKSFHLTHPEPLRLKTLMSYVKNAMNWPHLGWCETNNIEDLSPIERRFSKMVEVYDKYFWQEPSFDQSNLNSVLGDRLPVPPPISQEAVNMIVQFVREKYIQREAQQKNIRV